ncbi:MAG: exo-alpha-sialidase [Planctomycetota bacterium]|nr:exo-alpha-sialidase [Planctomycetota bacterium]MDA1212555.1 exo-alpha-sialidase [Planctomycetota bacterium]
MSDRIQVGTRKGLFTLVRHNSNWKVDKVDFLGSPVTMCLKDPRNNFSYAVLTLGHFGCKLHRSADDGKTWEECGVPKYPEGAVFAGMPGDDGTPTTKPASMKEIWILEPGGTDQPNLLWAGTIPGGLFRSNDNGMTWELIESLWDNPERMKWFGGGKDEPGIHSICVDPRDSKHIQLGISCGGVWSTSDTGATWERLGQGLRAEYMPPELAYDTASQDGHRMVRCKSAPDNLWIQHHNGIFKSTDDAHNWTEIKDVKPSTFGFGVAVHPSDPQTAWFVPGKKDEFRYPEEGKLIVTRTKDGGQTFEQITNGLPQDHCYDLVFRHALEVDETGDNLVFGSTTGGIWTSNNGGDTWTMLPNRLPPIYVTRFC